MDTNNPYSRIIAGTMHWGKWGKQLSKDGMIDLMQHCLSLGITTFDHADIYGGYTNEADFGKALSDSGISRDSIQLITKCGIQYVCDARENTVKHYEYGKDYIVWSAEQSLRNLETDYLDVLLLHRPSPLMNPDEIAEAVGLLAAQGKIKHFGVSNFTPSQIAMLETRVPVFGNQVEFSLTHDVPMYDGALDDCLANGRMAMAWSPLGSYFKGTDTRTERIAAVMESLGPKYEATADQLLLAWLMKHPARVSPVVGTTTKMRLEDAVKAVRIDLGLEDWFVLLEAAQGHKVP